jgi:hypothetical protein
MSPSRWLQEIPAACKNAGRPVSSAHSASQVARSLLVSRAGSPPPPSSDRVSRLVMLFRPASVPPVRKPSPAKPAAASRRGW